jgi:hypothetical protein
LRFGNNVAQRHFSQFGRICNFVLRPSKGSCTIEYETTDAAKNALLSAGVYNGESFNVAYSTKECSQSSELGDLEPVVQYELEAMKSNGTMYSVVSRPTAGKCIY